MFYYRELSLTKNVFQPGQVRLAIPLDSPRTQPAGIVQVYHDGVWGTVCDLNLAKTTLKAICRDFGHPAGYRFVPDCPKNNSVPILMNDVYCDGTEASIIECRHSGLGNANCYYDAITVQCCKFLLFTVLTIN